MSDSNTNEPLGDKSSAGSAQPPTEQPPIERPAESYASSPAPSARAGAAAAGALPVFPAAGPMRPTPITAIAGGLTVVWLLLAALIWLFLPADAAGAPGIVVAVIAVLLPVVLIWVAALGAQSAREMRAEARALRAAIDQMRDALARRAAADAAAPRTTAAPSPAPAPAFASRRDARATQPSADHKAALAPPQPADPADDQPALALGAPAEALADPVSIADFVRALNFPDSGEDREGIRALRRALEDRSIAKLIRAAQDVLNLLAQEGVFMDDLSPDRSRPEIWRRFAQGERGREIAALGGVRDRTSLALAGGRMRTDAIFRDAAHHFLRQFDRTFAEFEKNASDSEIADLAETRTARAFMLLGRVAGIFD